MKENKTVFQKLRGNEPIKSVSLFVQFVLLIAMIIVAVCTLFVYELNAVLQSLVVLLLLTMAYNDYKLLKRKGISILYVFAGIAFLFSMLVGK